VWQNLAIPSNEWKSRFLVATAQLFDTLHAHSIIVGDVSMRNLLWSPGGDPCVFLIDCDSMRVVGEEPAVPSAFTPDWDDPLDPLGNTIDSDRYKLALIILRVLTVVPAVCPEDSNVRFAGPGWSDRLSDLMQMAARAGRGQRLPAARWVEALENRSRIQLAPLSTPVRPPNKIKPAVRPTILINSGRV
jgi:hypothetical protein